MRLCSALLLAALLAVPAAAQVEGVGYRLTPAVSYVEFEGDAALTDGVLYGGGVGLSFGEFFELDGSYQLGRDFETDFSDFSGTEDDPALAAALAGLDPRPVDLERYGGGLRINLGRAGLVPFVTGGTGLIRFDPEDRDATRAIYLKGGAGLQLTGADRYALAVAAEVLAYRYNPGPTFFSPADLAAVGLGYDDFNQTTVVNRLLRGTVQIYLGGRRPGADTEVDRELRRQFSGGLSGLSLVVEPFYGRVEFDDAFAYRDQAFAGATAGVDLGPLVGLRGFYGRGVDDGDPTAFQDIQLYGGDVRLRLSEGASFVPFLTVGGGYLDVLDGYASDEGAEPGNIDAEDRPFAVGGVGVEFALSPRVRAVGEARAMLMSAQETDDVSQPEDVFVSPFFRGGLSLALGGGSGRPVAVVRQSELEAERARLEAEREALRAEALDRIAVLEGELAAARAARDTVAVATLTAERDAAIDTAVGTDVTMTEPDTAGTPATPLAAPATPAPAAAPETSAVSDRLVTLPVPAQGELYVRYGPPGGVMLGDGGLGGYAYDEALPPDDRAAVDAQVAAAGLDEAEVRELIRETLRQSLAAQDGEPLTEDDVARIERSIEDRIADRIGGRLAPQTGASDGRIQALERRQDELIDEIRALRVELARPAAGPVVIQPGAPTPPVDADRPATPVSPAAPAAAPVRYRPAYLISPTGGLGLGEGPDGLLVGLRVDYESGGPYRYVPELLIGVGSRSSIVLNADVAFPLASAARPQYGTPYIRTGIGLITYGGSDELPATFDQEPDDGATTLALNLGLGTDLALGGGRLFVDLTTGNFGAYNRLTAGYRFPLGRRAY